MSDFIAATLLANILEFIPNVQTKLEKEFLLEYCSVMGINHPQPNSRILKEMQNFYNRTGYLPEDLDVLSRFIIENCVCQIIPLEEIDIASKVLSAIIRRENKIASCSYIGLQLEFFKQEGRIANHDEFNEYLINLQRLNNDPERFHQENKMKVPTPNLELLVPQMCCKEDNCGLCMEPILENNECYKLPCNHLFHSNEEECLGVTVKKWLSENKCCPICKQEVIFLKKQETELSLEELNKKEELN